MGRETVVCLLLGPERLWNRYKEPFQNKMTDKNVLESEDGFIIILVSKICSLQIYLDFLILGSLILYCLAKEGVNIVYSSTSTLDTFWTVPAC